jgi:hypothetical protein
MHEYEWYMMILSIYFVFIGEDLSGVQKIVADVADMTSLHDMARFENNLTILSLLI